LEALVGSLEEENLSLKVEKNMLWERLGMMKEEYDIWREGTKKSVQKEEERKDKEKKKIEDARTQGVVLQITTDLDRVTWFRTKSLTIHEKLWGELLPCVQPPQNGSGKFNNRLLLDLLFFTFATGFSFKQTARSFRYNNELLCDSTISNWFDKTLTDLQPWSKKQIKLLEPEEWKGDSKKVQEDQQYKKYHETLFYYVDGTVIPTEDSSDPRRSRTMRNGKHGTSAIVFFLVVTPKGRIVHVSEEFREGSVHDKTHFNDDPIVSLLSKKYNKGVDSETWGKVTIDGEQYTYELCGDKAYPYADKPQGWWWRVTKTGTKTKDIDEDGKEKEGEAQNAKLDKVAFDPAIARLRGVVERVIGRVKDWPIFLNKTFCSYLDRVVLMVWFSCALSNWFLENSNKSQF
jgi:hypothetical protein